jgi:hypothetical protein
VAVINYYYNFYPFTLKVYDSNIHLAILCASTRVEIQDFTWRSQFIYTIMGSYTFLFRMNLFFYTEKGCPNPPKTQSLYYSEYNRKGGLDSDPFPIPIVLLCQYENQYRKNPHHNMGKIF